MQIMLATLGNSVQELRLPAPDDQVLPGIPWGRFDELFTPAYWRGQAWQHEHLQTFTNVRLGQTLAEEVAACLLGGYGMPAELGLAAFRRVRDAGLLEGTFSLDAIEKALSVPLLVGAVSRRYRFPRQKAYYISTSLQTLANLEEPPADRDLRDLLMKLPGIGAKTASWIVRNYRGSDDVAIIDVHILRAGRLAGIFQSDEKPTRHYFALEESFLCFAAAISTRPSLLDSLMWHYMRILSPSVNLRHSRLAH